MKYVKVAVIILFILSVGIFAAGMEKERRAEDPTKPVLTSDREILEISTSYEEADLLQGLTAQDGKDGDLTSEILVGEFSQFVEKGVCNLSYVVFDSSNQAATLTRKVKFTDYESPRLTLTEPLVFPAGKTENAMEFIGASDMIDASLSALVKQTESTIDYKNVGDYYIHVEVTNSFGDVEEQQLPVHVIEASHQALEIQLSSSLVYLKQGEAFDPNSYVEALNDTYGEALDPALVQAESNVNTGQPGCYEVHYQATSEKGQIGETWLTVIVRG